MIRKLLLSGFLLAAALPTTAFAAWHAATSTHFVVYTEGSTQSARNLATKLEKFEFVLRTISGVTRLGSPVRTKVYMMKTSGAVQDTMPFGGGGGVAGYFSGDMRGPFAVMTRSDEGETFGLAAQTVLFHELSHQFMFRYFPAAYPSWYVEGFADFYGTMQIGPKDVVEIGKPVENRYLGVRDNQWLPLDKLLLARSYGDVSDVSLLYSEGWLLVHYLSTTKNRPGQLKAYLSAINGGASFAAAAKIAFGDVAKLDGELRDYAGRAKLQTLILPFKPIDPGAIDVRDLSDAENALIGDDIRLSSGVPASEIGGFATRLADTAKRWPDDPYALSLLTEAQRLAGRSVEARAAVDRWMKVAPNDGLAVMNSALLTIAALRDGKVTDPARWNEARKLYVQANKLTPDEPRILRAFYESYLAQGQLPPMGAQNGLVTAFELLPEVEELRYMVALDFEQRGYIEDAIAVIRPLAYRVRSDAEKSAREKARDADARGKYRMAGQSDPESPRTMLERLEKMLAEKSKKPAG